jgi:hypothetical protein
VLQPVGALASAVGAVELWESDAARGALSRAVPARLRNASGPSCRRFCRVPAPSTWAMPVVIAARMLSELRSIGTKLVPGVCVATAEKCAKMCPHSQRRLLALPIDYESHLQPQLSRAHRCDLTSIRGLDRDNQQARWTMNLP